MLVSRKNLSLIHLVPREVPARINMPHVLHQSMEALSVSLACRELRKPLAKGLIQRRTLGASKRARLLNQVLVGTEGNILHT
jgi:hypothetical protein